MPTVLHFPTSADRRLVLIGGPLDGETFERESEHPLLWVAVDAEHKTHGYWDEWLAEDDERTNRPRFGHPFFHPTDHQYQPATMTLLGAYWSDPTARRTNEPRHAEWHELEDVVLELTSANWGRAQRVRRVTIVVEGQLVSTNRQELKQKVLDELERGERHFLIDFNQTGYIDASGLGVLVSVNKKVRERGGDVLLTGLNDDLVTLLELTKLNTIFTIEP